MFRHTLVALLLGLSSTVAQADPQRLQKVVICDDTEAILKGLQDGRYKESPTWSGISSGKDSSFVIMVNEETGTWTIVQFNSTAACILGEGDASRMMENKKNHL